MNKLPSLTTLLLKRNPLFDTNPYYHNFNFILALIKRLEKLDREPVKKETRDDAEKYYLRMIYLDYLEQCKDTLNRQKFLDENPCFLDILNKFGEPIVEKKLTKQEQIQQNFLTINIHDEQNPDSSRRFLRKQIPKTMKVTNLKFMLKRLLRMDIFEEFELNVRSINDDLNVKKKDFSCTFVNFSSYFPFVTG